MGTRGFKATVRATGAAVVVAAAAIAGAPIAVCAADDDALRQQVEQKIRLTAMLLIDSNTAQRISASSNAAAMAHLNEGRLHHARAAELLARGDVAGAREAADEALRHLALARRLVPDAPAEQAAARARHEQMLASTERLAAALRARVGATAHGDGGALVAAEGLVDSARRHAEHGRYDEANRALAMADQHVLDGLRRTLRSTTLDYTPRFASPAEEFQHELARYRSLADLVPLAVDELKPEPATLALIERYSDISSSLRAQAVRQYEAGDPVGALVHIRGASLHLQRALQAAGLVTPAPTGDSQ